MLLFATFLLLAARVTIAAEPPTLRVDYFHTGNANEEHFSLDRVVVEPLPWPGNPAQPLDDTNLGKYLFEVADSATGQLRFSRGFSSIYGEWETTAEAKNINRTFSESLRFPLVDRPVRLAIKKRDARNLFREVWSMALDPAGKFVERGAAAAAAGPLLKLHDSGDPAKKLDLLILGDGYTAAERAKFERDARRLVAVLLATSPFKERQRDINVWGLSPASPQSGISRPSQQDLPPDPPRHDLRRVRFRALRAHIRQPRLPRSRRERPLRCRRDPGQQCDLWRRRHLRPVQHRRRGQRLGALHFRP